MVGDIPVRVGDRVTNATILTTVDDNQGLEVYLQVPVQQAPNLSVGLPVRIVDDRGAEIVTTKVTFVAPSVDPQTQIGAGQGRARPAGHVPHRSVRAGPRRLALGAGADHPAGGGDPRSTAASSPSSPRPARAAPPWPASGRSSWAR